MGGYFVLLMYFAYENRRGPLNIYFLLDSSLLWDTYSYFQTYFLGANQAVYLDFIGYTVMIFG